MGYPNQALQQLEAAFALSNESSHPYSLALAQYHAAVAHHVRQDWRRMQDMAEATMALAAEYIFPYWLASAQILKGWTLTIQGQAEAGIQLMEQGLADYQKIGAILNCPYSLTLLAEAYSANGDIAEGLTLLQEAQQLANLNKGHFYQAEMFRLQGELTLKEFQALSSKFQVSLPTAVEAQAEEYFLKAIDLARQQQAKRLELRAVISLSRLWRTQGKRQEAQQQLANLYAWFTEGFDSVDLQEARALLNELSS